MCTLVPRPPNFDHNGCVFVLVPSDLMLLAVETEATIRAKLYHTEHIFFLGFMNLKNSEVKVLSPVLFTLRFPASEGLIVSCAGRLCFRNIMADCWTLFLAWKTAPPQHTTLETQDGEILEYHYFSFFFVDELIQVRHSDLGVVTSWLLNLRSAVDIINNRVAKDLGDKKAPGVLVRRRHDVLRGVCACMVFPLLADRLERECEPLRSREQSERSHLRELHKSLYDVVLLLCP